MLTPATIDTAARVALVCMFPPSAIDKVWHWRDALAQTAGARLPGPQLVGPAMLVAAIAVEGVAPVMIVGHWWDRPGALLLAAFCGVTAVLYHPFWAYPDFFAEDPKSVAREHFWQFLKNFCIVGGLMLVALAGSGPPRWRIASSWIRAKSAFMAEACEGEHGGGDHETHASGSLRLGPPDGV